MPAELVAITSDLRWLRTSIRRVGGWLQTELYLETGGRALSVAFDALPDRAFLLGVTAIRGLQVHEATGDEPPFSEARRYRVRIFSGEPPGEHEAFGNYVRYGPIEPHGPIGPA